MLPTRVSRCAIVTSPSQVRNNYSLLIKQCMEYHATGGPAQQVRDNLVRNPKRLNDECYIRSELIEDLIYSFGSASGRCCFFLSRLNGNHFFHFEQTQKRTWKTSMHCCVVDLEATSGN